MIHPEASHSWTEGIEGPSRSFDEKVAPLAQSAQFPLSATRKEVMKGFQMWDRSYSPRRKKNPKASTDPPLRESKIGKMCTLCKINRNVGGPEPLHFLPRTPRMQNVPSFQHGLQECWNFSFQDVSD